MTGGDHLEHHRFRRWYGRAYLPGHHHHTHDTAARTRCQIPLCRHQAWLGSDIIPKEGLPFTTVDIQGFERHLTPENLLRAGRAMIGVAKAARIVRSFHPDVAVGTGGYVCGPILLAASLMHIPTLIQEQNVVPGITNKLLSRFVTRIAAGTKEAMRHFPQDKVVFTGNPIRSEVLSAQREDGAAVFGLDPAKLTVLVSGGSRGARAINRAMIGVLSHAAHHPEVQFLHVTGKNEYEDVLARLAKAGVNWRSVRISW